MALMSTVALASAASFVVLASSGAALTNPSSAHAVQGNLGVTATMAVDRAAHTATALPDGRVLVAGGFVEKGSPVGAELYDATTGRFSAVPPMIETRHSHSAILLPDGTVLLADGRVLVAGGHRGRRADIVLHASAEVYDVASGTFTRVGEMGVRRHKHDAVRLREGLVLVTGGSDERDSDGVYDTTELFDPKTGIFTAGPSLVLPRYKHEGSSVLLPNGHVLIAGGAPQAETYDPARRHFALVAGAARMVGLFSAVAPIGSGAALITGGYGRGHGPQASAWVYQP